jgi:hypothetical protein
MCGTHVAAAFSQLGGPVVQVGTHNTAGRGSAHRVVQHTGLGPSVPGHHNGGRWFVARAAMGSSYLRAALAGCA